nr:Arc family DNA-binding protein [uncultured Albidiferax sp.]
MEKPPQRKPYSLRMPVDLEKWLKHEAVDNSRSLTAEIVTRLEESRRQQLQKKAEDAK